jgi:hypothetical protein
VHDLTYIAAIFGTGLGLMVALILLDKLAQTGRTFLRVRRLRRRLRLHRVRYVRRQFRPPLPKWLRSKQVPLMWMGPVSGNGKKPGEIRALRGKR